MKIIGLTGGIGMGKSVSAGFWRDRGCPVVDTDDLARDAVAPGQPALKQIADAFGSEMLDDRGWLRRDALASLVFGDEGERKKLEGILHPRIRAAWQSEVARWKTQGMSVGMVVIPLLFETEAAGLFDRIICVACSESTQRERLRHRGWTDAQVRQRLGSQWPTGRKMDQSDHVIWTEGRLEVHEEQVERLWGKSLCGWQGQLPWGE